MFKKSTYILSALAFAISLSSCSMVDIVRKEHEVTTEGYRESKAQALRRSANSAPSGIPTQNPASVPVIINDPFALSNAMANGANPAYVNGLGRNVYIQQGPNSLVPSNPSYQNPYRSAVSSSTNPTNNTLYGIYRDGVKRY